MQGQESIQELSREERQSRQRADQREHHRGLWLRQQARGIHDWLLGPLYRRVLRDDPARFIVVCRGRTGSNLLMHLLASHSRIRQHWEIFELHNPRRQQHKDRICEIGSLAYMNEFLVRQSNEQYVGFKVIYYQLEPSYEQRWGLPDMEPVRRYLQEDLTLKVIHLKRRNILRSLVSDRVAAQNKTYILYSPDRRDLETRIELSADECEREFRRVTENQQQFDRMFEQHRPLEMTYEALTAQQEQECRRVQDFLGVKYQRLESPTVQQIVRTLPEVLINYAELKQHFDGTEWSFMFDD